MPTKRARCAGAVRLLRDVGRMLGDEDEDDQLTLTSSTVSVSGLLTRIHSLPPMRSNNCG